MKLSGQGELENMTGASGTCGTITEFLAGVSWELWKAWRQDRAVKVLGEIMTQHFPRLGKGVNL